MQTKRHTLKSRLSEKTEFKVKKEVRKKQVKVQKKYETKKRETTDYRYMGNITVQLMIIRMLENPNGSREKIMDISIQFEDIRFDKITNAIKLNGDIDEEAKNAIKQLDKKMSYNTSLKVMNVEHDIHIYNKGTEYRNIRMKNSTSYKYDGYETQQWDTNTGKCVFTVPTEILKDLKLYVITKT